MAQTDDEYTDDVSHSGSVDDDGAKKKKKSKKKKKKNDAIDGAAPTGADEVETVSESSSATDVPVTIAAENNPSESVATATVASCVGEAAEDEGGGVSKKKKKKRGGGGSNGGGGGASTAPTEDAAQRFQRFLDELKGGTEPAIADLSRCGVGDKKLRTLVTAIRTRGARCAVETLDLTHNAVSDAGAAGLCAALTADGGVEGQIAPRLSLLSLLGNPLGDKGSELCAHALLSRAEVALILPARSSASMEGGVEGGAEGGEESGADRGGVVREVGAYFACRGIDDLPPPWHGPPAQTPSGQVDVGEPVLVRNSPLGFDEAVGALEDWRAATQGERAGDESADGARDSVLVVDSLRELLSVVDGEASAVGANPKLLPKGLKWCAKHLDVLHALLLPPRPPRVRYGVDGLSYAPDGTPVRPDGWARRLGLRRLLIVQIIERLVGAKRPPLTAAIAEAAPSLLVDAAALLVRHPSSGVLATAVVRLLRAALLAKPLRLALVATGATTSGATTSGTTTAGATCHLRSS